MSELITEPQSDDMTGFNPEVEKIIEQQAGDVDGNLYTIQKRIPLSPEELEEKRVNKIKTAISGLEGKLIDGSITELELTRLNALYKLLSL